MPGRPYLCKALRCRLTPDFSSYQWSRPTRARLIHPSGETFGLSFCPKSGRKSGGSARAREWFSEGRMTMTSEAHRPCLIRPITGHSQNKKNSVDLSHTLPLHRIPLPNGRPPCRPQSSPNRIMAAKRRRLIGSSGDRQSGSGRVCASHIPSRSATLDPASVDDAMPSRGAPRHRLALAAH
jgi:hypothetical protein